MAKVFIVMEIDQRRLTSMLTLLSGNTTHIESSALQAVGALLIKSLLEPDAMPGYPIDAELDRFGLILRSSHPKNPLE